MLDSLSFKFEPNDDEEEYASAYDLYLGDHEEPVGLVFVRDANFVWQRADNVLSSIDSRKVAELFVCSPKLISTVRRFVQWADNLTKGRRPHLDPIVADARALLTELDN